MKNWLAASGLILGMSAPALAGDYASQISAYRRAHGLSSVRIDSRPSAVALQQAQAIASTGTISHSAGGSFSSRVASLRKSRVAENIAVGFLSFSEMLKQWEDSAGHRENLDARCEEGRRGFGGQREVALSHVLGDGDH